MLSRLRKIKMYRTLRHSLAVILPAAGICLLCVISTPAQESGMQMGWDTASINQLLQQAKKVTLGGHTDSAAGMYRMAARQSLALGYDYGIIKSEIGIGNISINNGDYNAALKRYAEAMKQCTSARSKTLLTTLYNNTGNIYTLQGNYEKSAGQYELALQCSERYGSELPSETIYNNLSIALNKLNRPQRSLFYLEKAERLALESSNYLTLADIYNNKGAAYTELGDRKKSAECFDDAVLISRKYGYQNTLYSALVNLGIYHLNDNRVKEAIAKFEEADGIEANINSYYKNLKMLAGGAAYLKNKDYDRAAPLLEASLAQAQALGNLKDQATTHTLLAELNRATGNYRQAFEHKSLELLLSDSLKKKETAYIVADMEAKYGAALKDKELSKKLLTISQQSEALSRKNRWLAAGIVCCLMAVLLALVQRRSFRRRQRLKDQELRLLKERQKNVAMKSLLDGAENERIRLSREIHDSIMVQFSVVKMNLSVFAGANARLPAPGQLDPVIKQLDEATDNLRRTAHNLMPDRLMEDGLPEAVFYFCNNLQKSVPLHISFQPIGLLPPLPTAFQLALYRVIQELVQNIIKHAAATEAIVQLSCEDDLLSVTVEDDGQGMNAAHRRGAGLKSIEARVHEFAGRLHIESTPGIGTTVHLEFSVEKINGTKDYTDKTYI